MATTIEVEVMFFETDPDTGTFRRQRVGLDAVHTLDRENVWYIILSDDASGIVAVDDARRILNGTIVDRLAVVQWDDSPVGVAFLLRRVGEICLGIWEDSSWTWISESDPFTTEVAIAGAGSDFPADALMFHLVSTPVSSAHSDFATALFNADMY